MAFVRKHYIPKRVKIQTVMKMQKLFCTLRWNNFLSEKDGNCAKNVHKIVRKQKRGHFLVLI